jgi:hypothetical protein
MDKIKITSGDLTIQAQLNDSETAQQILDVLPVEGKASVWGDEIYFTIPLELPLETDAREEMAIGELAFWPQGNAFCIFFGPTPVSVDDAPRAYSPVNVFGSVIGDASVFKKVADGAEIEVSLAVS